MITTGLLAERSPRSLRAWFLRLSLGRAAAGVQVCCAGEHPVPVPSAVLCQERELGLWDSGAFDVFCSQTMKVLQRSNTTGGFAVCLGACSGAHDFLWRPPTAEGFGSCQNSEDSTALKCVLRLAVPFSDCFTR